MKKVISCLFMVLMLLSLSACEKKAGSEPEAEPEETGYILTHYHALPDTITDISRCYLEGDKIYLCCREEADEENASYYVAMINTDGTNFQKLSLIFSDTEILLDIAPDAQAGLWGLFMTPGVEDEYTASYALRRFDKSGNPTSVIYLTPLLEEADALHYAGRDLYLNTDGEGNLCVTVKSVRTYCFLFDQAGNALFSLVDNWSPLTAITTADGHIMVCISNGDENYFLLPIDMDTQYWDYSRRTAIGAVNNVFSGADDVRYYLYDTAGFYSNDLETGEKDKLFIWSNLGLASGDSHICPLSDGRFAVVAGTFNQTQQLSYEFCIAEPGEDERTVLTMLSVKPDNSLLEAIALFNKSNDEYKVELTSLFSMNENVSSEDWTNAIQRLNIEMISGKIPDLMDLNNLSIEALSGSGILEDLYPYLENDQTINLDDYFDNVFTALSIHGKLPYITSSVHVYTMFADANVVGAERGWTVDEYIKLKNSGEIVTAGLEPSQFLEMLLVADTQFVDWKTGECSFDSEAFIDLLELCKSMADSEESNQFISADSQANCRYAGVLSVVDTAWYNNTLFGGNANPIGFPNASGEVLHILKPANRIGFSTACEHKDGAWAFVRSFLEPTLQESGWFFPYLKSSFEKVSAAAMKGNTIWTGGMHDGKITEADIVLTREILSTAKYCSNSDDGLVEVILSWAQDYFNGIRTAQEAATAIQSRAKIYVGEHM